MWNVPRDCSDEGNPNDCFGGGLGQWEGGLFLVRIQSVRKTDGQTHGIVVPDRKLRPDLKFDPLVPDPTESLREARIAGFDNDQDRGQDRTSATMSAKPISKNAMGKNPRLNPAAVASGTATRNITRTRRKPGRDHLGTGIFSRIWRTMVDDFRSLNFEFRTQHHAVFEDRLNQDAHIVWRHVIPAVQCGMGAAGKKKRLSGPRTGSDKDAVMFPWSRG